MLGPWRCGVLGVLAASVTACSMLVPVGDLSSGESSVGTGDGGPGSVDARAGCGQARDVTLCRDFDREDLLAEGFAMAQNSVNVSVDSVAAVSAPRSLVAALPAGARSGSVSNIYKDVFGTPPRDIRLQVDIQSRERPRNYKVKVLELAFAQGTDAEHAVAVFFRGNTAQLEELYVESSSKTKKRPELEELGGLPEKAEEWAHLDLHIEVGTPTRITTRWNDGNEVVHVLNGAAWTPTAPTLIVGITYIEDVAPADAATPWTIRYDNLVFDMR